MPYPLMERAVNAPLRKKVRGEWVVVPPKSTKAKKADHNERTRKWMEQEGLFPYRVDHYDGKLMMAQDLFGIFDFVGLADGRTVGVQVTSHANASSRRKKILASSAYLRCKKAGWEVVLLTWKPVGVRWRATAECL